MTPLRTALAAVPAATLLLLTNPAPAAAQSPDAWQSCTAVAEPAARLACFDAWARGQAPAGRQTAGVEPAPVASGPGPAAPQPTAVAVPTATAKAHEDAPGSDRLRLTRKNGCHNPAATPLSRFWELEGSTDCGNFGLRGFRPTSVAIATANSVNTQPTSTNPLNNVAAATPYRRTEMRLQLSVRTKIASDLLSDAYAGASDSLWFAYTQQSYWQLFTPELSRPFRSTDHEPEVMYIHPLQSADSSRWRLRYAGLGVVHHSNGQSLPWSRSWNRAYLMAGAEHGSLSVTGRVWRRIKEDASSDDNPAISSTYGRAELSVGWRVAQQDELRVTARHNLHRSANGSWRLEWFRTLLADDGSGPSGGLQLHTQLFSGYGDSLLDYNRRRTMLSIGLSLSDW